MPRWPSSIALLESELLNAPIIMLALSCGFVDTLVKHKLITRASPKTLPNTGGRWYTNYLALSGGKTILVYSGIFVCEISYTVKHRLEKEE